MTDFKQKVAELSEVIPFKLRIGSGIGQGKDEKGKKLYDKYVVMGYIDARDCMDRLDKVFGPDHQNTYKEIGGKAYCEVSLRDGKKRITRSDVGDPTAISKNKGEASDSFKRACVHRGLGRFLYTMPRMQITHEEAIKNKYDIAGFINKKYEAILKKRADDYKIKIDEMKSKYESSDDSTDEPDVDEKNMTEIQLDFK